MYTNSNIGTCIKGKNLYWVSLIIYMAGLPTTFHLPTLKLVVTRLVLNVIWNVAMNRCLIDNVELWVCIKKLRTLTWIYFNGNTF